MKKDKKLTAQQQEEKQELMIECGELISKRQKLLLGKFATVMGFLEIGAIVAINLALYFTGVTAKLADYLMISKGWTIFILVAATFLVWAIVTSPITRIIGKAHLANMRKKHKDEIEKLDRQIDELKKQIISKFGGDEKTVEKQCAKAYQKKLDAEAAERRREEARHRQEINESLYLSGSDSSSSDSSSSSSSSSSQISSGYFYEDSNPNRKDSYVDNWGREIAYRDGNRVYSSETHDYVGFVSGNRMYDENGEIMGSFDENGKFTKL